MTIDTDAESRIQVRHHKSCPRLKTRSSHFDGPNPISMSAPSSLALGFDLSTQQLKIVAIDVYNLETFYEQSLTFETDFPHYKTTKGVYSNEQTHEVYSPVEMWIEAVDVILGRMKDDGFPFANVVSISGAGQVIHHCKVGGINSSNMLRCFGQRTPRNFRGRWNQGNV